jgi:hypothetical protein
MLHMIFPKPMTPNKNSPGMKYEVKGEFPKSVRGAPRGL